MYNIMSPDNHTISMNDFNTPEEATKFYIEWKKRFIQQGYYSSNNGKILLEDLDNECYLVINKNGIYNIH